MVIEVFVLNYLSSKLDVPVYMEFPITPDEKFIVLYKGDSGRENRLDSAMMVADSYAPSLFEASTLNESVKAAMDSLVDLPQVSASRLQNDYPFTDTQNERRRYQAVYDITYY